MDKKHSEKIDFHLIWKNNHKREVKEMRTTSQNLLKYSSSCKLRDQL